jgi:SAM-dependent methyltransferase
MPDLERTRGGLASCRTTPAAFRAELLAVPEADHDAWIDRLFGIEELPQDGPDLPRGCVPYLPCSVETLLRMIDVAQIDSSDVFVDLGSGIGRVTALTHLLTGADAIGIEVQSALVRKSRELITRSNTPRVSVVEGDAAALIRHIDSGSVFFLYCPFSGERLDQVMDALEDIARTRVVRVCCVDLRLPPRPWLALVSMSDNLAVYRGGRS